MQTSGKLLEDTNVINGVVVKYSEPPESRKPRTKWRLYVFKGNEELPILYIHRQSAYLLGRDRKVADIPLDHPSCSKQHAVLQYRLVDYSRADGSRGKRVAPYVLDLNSANGTFVNNQRIESQKFVQVLEKDVLKFGFSSREYVLLHDQSKECEEEDPGVD
jgi:smad nuclear-interacting protein 1